ncbi:SCF ubiquitin ligase, SKP1 component [Heracleum sosnowskyi]|uniref:SKP1-like protein n=1 Tax=Heracleum sosnowskyi TaxID=360622 RepID=A0AAD8MMX1_9APIA|nr:SCF ubiquitin ligase, SKP1 component [Heracleum sosnowskyi]
MSSDKKWITFKTSDDEEFVVEDSVGMMSQTVKNIVEDGCEPFVIPLKNIDGKTMGKIIEYCKKHIEESDEAVLEEFNAQFLDLDQADLYDLYLAVNFLEIKDLLERVTDKVVGMIEGRSSEEIRKIFNIKNDLSPEEIEESRRENCWTRQQ